MTIYLMQDVSNCLKLMIKISVFKVFSHNENLD